MDLNLVMKIMELKQCFDQPKYRVVSHLVMLLIMASRDTEQEFNDAGEFMGDVLDRLANESQDPFKHVFEVNSLVWKLPNSSKGIMFGNDELSIEALTKYVSDGMSVWNEEYLDSVGDQSKLDEFKSFYSNLQALSRDALSEKGLSDPSLEKFRDLVFNTLLSPPLKVTVINRDS